MPVAVVYLRVNDQEFQGVPQRVEMTYMAYVEFAIEDTTQKFDVSVALKAFEP